MIQERWVFLDGEEVASSPISIEEFSPWALKGRGVFETMRSYEGKIFLLKEHLERFFQGLKSLKMKTAYTPAKVRTYLYQALRSNNLSDARIRLTAWCDNHKRVRLSVIAWPYKSPGPRQYRRGYQVSVSRQQWIAPQVHAIKSIDYWPYLKAYHAARARGFDEVILLNTHGFVAEGTRSNIFVVDKGSLCTPPLSSGCLDGVTRRGVIKMAGRLKILVLEKNLLPRQVSQADEIFLTNSLIGIMPVTRLRQKTIGSGVMGPVTARLLKAYREQVHRGARKP